MTAQEYVLQLYPDAKIEKRWLPRQDYDKLYSYHCVINNDEILGKSHGNERGAWVNAKKLMTIDKKELWKLL